MNRHYYTVDEQGSTLFISDKNQQVKNEYWYDAFGNVLEAQEQVHNRITYTGQQFDGITGQYYLRARFYNPIVGRFTQEDIYRGDGLNLYAYCGNNPIRYFDTSGYKRECPESKENNFNKRTKRTPHIGNTPDEAAISALKSANPKSIRKNKEYVGFVYEKNGMYHATIPVSGSGRSYIAKAAQPQVPNGGKIVGGYHTHGDYSIIENPNTKKEKIIRTSDKSMDDFNSDNFSNSDKLFAKGASNAQGVEYRSYLGTPSGEFKVYIPTYSGEVEYVIVK